MGALGDDTGTAYPGALDTRQTFANVADPDPDGSTRMDAEVLNDVLKAIIAIETELGIDPAGAFATVVVHLADKASLTGANAFAGVALQSLTRTDDDPSQEILKLISTRATRLDDDEIYMTFYMPDSGGTQDEWARITCSATDITTGADADSLLEFETLAAGATTRVLRMGFTAAGAFQFGFSTLMATLVTFTQTYATADLTHAARTAATLTDDTTGAAPDGTIADLTAYAASVPWDGATIFPSAADEAAIETGFEETRSAIGELADQVNKVIADQVDTAQALNSLIDALEAHGIVLVT